MEHPAAIGTQEFMSFGTVHKAVLIQMRKKTKTVGQTQTGNNSVRVHQTSAHVHHFTGWFVMKRLKIV